MNFGRFVSDYDRLPACFQEVVPLLIASLIYHLDKIVKDLHPSHPLFVSRFYTETYRIEILDEILEPSLGRCVITGMESSGVPDTYHVMLTLSNKINHMESVILDTKDVILNTINNTTPVAFPVTPITPGKMIFIFNYHVVLITVPLLC